MQMTFWLPEKTYGLKNNRGDWKDEMLAKSVVESRHVHYTVIFLTDLCIFTPSISVKLNKPLTLSSKKIPKVTDKFWSRGSFIETVMISYK